MPNRCTSRSVSRQPNKQRNSHYARVAVLYWFGYYMSMVLFNNFRV
nr:MAG TPA: hypothetical protein [Caudoviricetes sp.]DAP01614.1 MAG TPA: hypothetical protein [Caudoviricetes sp.]